FEDKNIVHVNGKIDPLNDLEVVNLELIFADLEVIEKRTGKIAKKAQLKVDQEAIDEYNVLMKIKESLEKGISARDIDLTKDEISLVKGYEFLSLKPMIYVLNIAEDEIKTGNSYTKEVMEFAKSTNTKCLTISAKIEDELAKLDDETKSIFMEELDLKESGLNRLAKEAYDLLGLATYFTAGENEAKAWTFKKGMKAPECAGIIHTDFEKGFIKAEVTSYNDFIKYGGLKEAREAGKMRLEGKEYIFQDGDIVLFRFNV
ncbi:MAG: redox-regulated ATPase YchF, partial [Bacilli bacterium]|nr:redox-regulated ATPase YchF [Bacilli bacterium]